MSQTAYSIEQPIAFVGMFADFGSSYVRSARNTDAGNVPFGIAVKKGTNDDDFALPTAGADKIIGVLASSHARDNISLLGATDAVKPSAMANLCLRGRVYVLPEQAMIPTDAVFFRFATGAGGSQKGALRKDADTATAAAWNGARLLTTSTVTVPAVLDFDATARYF
jgi:hypothetical protein